MNTEQVFNSINSLIGHAPFWDDNTQNLFYCDIFSGTICRYDWKTKQTVCGRIQGESQVSFIIPVRNNNNQFVVGCGNKILLINWDAYNQIVRTETVLGKLSSNNVRFNDGICDQQGRLYIGTCRNEDVGDVFEGKRDCGLYKFTVKNGLQSMKEQFGHISGLGIDEVQKKMYLVDSTDMKIKQYDWDDSTGNITNEKVFFDMTNQGVMKQNVPYGMTIDCNGNLYVCMNGGGKVVKIDVNNRCIDYEFKFITQNLTNCTFGGRNKTTMICTTACVDFDGNMRLNQQNQTQQVLNGRLQQCKNMKIQGQKNQRFNQNQNF